MRWTGSHFLFLQLLAGIRVLAVTCFSDAWLTTWALRVTCACLTFFVGIVKCQPYCCSVGLNTIYNMTMFSCLNAVWFVPPSSAVGKDWRAAVLITGVSNNTIPQEVGALIFHFGRDQGPAFGSRVNLEHFILDDLCIALMCRRMYNQSYYMPQGLCAALCVGKVFWVFFFILLTFIPYIVYRHCPCAYPIMDIYIIL